MLLGTYYLVSSLGALEHVMPHRRLYADIVSGASNLSDGIVSVKCATDRSSHAVKDTFRAIFQHFHSATRAINQLQADQC